MIDFIKDADCTKETPVKLGVPDAPIYGKGIKLKPRVDGRTDSEHFKKIYLPELLPLEEYDLIVVLISGGKDSVACYLKLLELGVSQLLYGVHTAGVAVIAVPKFAAGQQFGQMVVADVIYTKVNDAPYDFMQ